MFVRVRVVVDDNVTVVMVVLAEGMTVDEVIVVFVVPIVVVV